jgi:hypothetical protein
MFEKTSIGEWVVLGLSLIFALVTTFSRPIYESGSYIAGFFIGMFILSIIVLYIIYWIIKKAYPKSQYWGIIFWILAIIGIPLIIIFVLAVIAAFVFGMAGSTPNSYETVSTVTIPTIQTIVPAPTIINSIGNPGWVRYTNNDDHFSVYRPSDWTVQELPKSQIPNDNKIDTSLIMNKFVYIFTPNLKGFIMIYGVDTSGTLYSIFNDPGKTQISDTLYDQFIDGLPLGFTDTNPVKLIGVIKDSNYYSINGYPARKVTLNTQVNGQSLNGDFYLIAHENRYYIEGYFAMIGSTQSDASTASGILRTFTVN